MHVSTRKLTNGTASMAIMLMIRTLTNRAASINIMIRTLLDGTAYMNIMTRTLSKFKASMNLVIRRGTNGGSNCRHGCCCYCRVHGGAAALTATTAVSLIRIMHLGRGPVVPVLLELVTFARQLRRRKHVVHGVQLVDALLRPP